MKCRIIIGLMGFVGLVGLTGCGEKAGNPERWSYRVMEVNNYERAEARKVMGTGINYSSEKYDQCERMPGHIDVSSTELNKLGEEGWELVGVVPELETTRPREGMNIRTGSAQLIFKKRW